MGVQNATRFADTILGLGGDVFPFGVIGAASLAGGAAAVLVAVFLTRLALAEADFVVVA